MQLRLGQTMLFHQHSLRNPELAYAHWLPSHVLNIKSNNIFVMREEKIKLYIVIYLKLVARPVYTFPSVKLLKSIYLSK